MDDPPHDKHGNLIMFSLSLPDDISDLDKNVLKYYSKSKYKAVYRFRKHLMKAGDFTVKKIDFIENDKPFCCGI